MPCVVRLIATLIIMLGVHAVYAQRNKVKPFAPELFPRNISGGVCGFTKDGNTIYFVREDTILRRAVLYEASRRKRRWTNVRTLPFSGIHNDMGGRIADDGRRLYFTSDRPGGADSNDHWNIWYAEKDIDGNWQEPVALTTINSKGAECCPLPFKDGLIFSATRGDSSAWWIRYADEQGAEHVMPNLNEDKTWQWPAAYDIKYRVMLLNSMGRTDRIGKDDIYISFYEKNIFSIPVNIGRPVNTEVYEDSAILSPDNKWMIFCRHTTHDTPSQVLCIRWKLIVRKLMKNKTTLHSDL